MCETYRTLSENLSSLSCICPQGSAHKLKLFLEFAPQLGRSEVPDPYYGGASGFDQVIDLIREAGRGLLDDIRTHHLD